jgi:NADH:ubiquinone oxidoreductase subunit 5 (subunit L)/multisubunit Na+/H+ antiporter MnhA subunit
MVTAGIFLIIRLSPLFSTAPGILMLATFVGGITALFAGLCALVQTDMKRIVAFSTTSQLGYMLLTCGFSHYFVAFFHLLNHAFFKAMLFMTMGIVIHIIRSEQDLRKTGGLLLIIPLIYTAIQIGNSSLTGFFFTSGFFSKDLILEISLLQHTIFIDSLLQQMALLTAVLTFLYSSRVVYYLFLNTVQINNRLNFHFTKDKAYLFTILAILPLIILSIIFGFFFRTWFVSSTNIFENAVFSTNFLVENNYYLVLAAENLAFYLKVLPVILCFIFIIFGLNNINFLSFFILFTSLNINTTSIYSFYSKISHFFYFRWYSDKYFDNFFFKTLIVGQRYVIEVIEKGIFDLFQFNKKNSLLSSAFTLSNLVKIFENEKYAVYYSFIIISFFLFFMIF